MALEMMLAFFEDLEQVRGRSRNTIMAYRRDLDLFEKFYDKSKELLGFYEFMKEQGLSARSQARVISSVRTYFKFCQLRGAKVPLLKELRPPKVKVSLPRPLTLSEFERLFKACEVESLQRPSDELVGAGATHGEGASVTTDGVDATSAGSLRTARNQITLLLLYGLGCRVTELIGLSLQNYHEIDNWLVVLGKGNKERVIPVAENLSIELKKYITDIRPHLLKEATPSIIINDRGHRPSRVDIWRWLAAWSARAGFDEPVSPHRFRHGCATALLESGADLRSIQLLLGHASIQTTQVYTTVTTKNLTDTIEKHHPLSQLED